jgi:hypothetical protein
LNEEKWRLIAISSNGDPRQIFLDYGPQTPGIRNWYRNIEK